MYKIDETRPTEEGTVFETTINNTKMKALFDTGATKSVMSGKMYRDLKLGPLDDSNLPSVVGANGSSLGVMGRIRCTIAFEKDEDKFDQTFLVCENLQRGVILGKDFARQNCAGVYWTPHNTRVLHTNLKTIAETKELVPSGTAAIHVKQTTKLPPRSLAVVDVNINTTSEDKIRMIPDRLCQSRHPNMYMMGFDADLSKRGKDTVAPFVLINLSHTENVRLRKDTVVGWTEKDDTEGEVFQVETLDTTPQIWTNPEHRERSPSSSKSQKIQVTKKLTRILIYTRFSPQRRTSLNRQQRSMHTERWIWKTRSSRRKPKRSFTSYVTGMIK